MPGLSYPFFFSCESCGERVKVTRQQARDLSPNPDSIDAVDAVLQKKHGWAKDHRGAYCPNGDPLD